MLYQIVRHESDLLWVVMRGHMEMHHADAFFQDIWGRLDDSPHPTDLLVDGREMHSANYAARRRSEQVAHHPHLGHIAFVVEQKHMLVFAPMVRLFSGIGLFGNEHDALKFLLSSRGLPSLHESKLPNLPGRPAEVVTKRSAETKAVHKASAVSEPVVAAPSVEASTPTAAAPMDVMPAAAEVEAVLSSAPISVMPTATAETPKSAPTNVVPTAEDVEALTAAAPISIIPTATVAASHSTATASEPAPADRWPEMADAPAETTATPAAEPQPTAAAPQPEANGNRNGHSNGNGKSYSNGSGSGNGYPKAYQSSVISQSPHYVPAPPPATRSLSRLTNVISWWTGNFRAFNDLREQEQAQKQAQSGSPTQSP